MLVGFNDGLLEGLLFEGILEGSNDGLLEGSSDGILEGSTDSVCEGLENGSL